MPHSKYHDHNEINILLYNIIMLHASFPCHIHLSMVLYSWVLVGSMANKLLNEQCLKRNLNCNNLIEFHRVCCNNYKSLVLLFLVNHICCIYIRMLQALTILIILNTILSRETLRPTNKQPTNQQQQQHNR